MSGWQIEYIPAGGGSPVSTRKMDTLEMALSLAIDHGWTRDVAEIVAIHGPGRSIRGDELTALLAKARTAS